MTVRVRAIVIVSALAALAAFCVVQDRVTNEGARRYGLLQRQALAGHGRPVTIDEVMRPAIDRSVHEGLLWGGGVLIAGGALAVAMRGRSS